MGRGNDGSFGRKVPLESTVDSTFPEGLSSQS